MRLTTLLAGGFWVAVLVAASSPARPAEVDARPAQPTPIQLETVALRVNRLDAMVAFYTEAFGARFREVTTGGVKSQFGTMAGVTFKFVPLRTSVDFVGYPIHQLGFNVISIEKVVAAAVRNGGRTEGEMIRDDRMIHAAIRDPDGNTIELYQLR